MTLFTFSITVSFAWNPGRLCFRESLIVESCIQTLSEYSFWKQSASPRLENLRENIAMLGTVIRSRGAPVGLHCRQSIGSRFPQPRDGDCCEFSRVHHRSPGPL